MPTLLLALRARRGSTPDERAGTHDRLRTWWASAGDLVPGAIVTVLVADQDQRPVRGGDDPEIAPAVDAVVTILGSGDAGAPGSRDDEPSKPSEPSDRAPSICDAPATPIPDEVLAAAVASADAWGAAEVGAWWADTYVRLGSVRAGTAGVAAPGVEQVALMGRADGLGHAEFAAHWTERHTPLALRHHVGLARYVQHVVTAPVELGLGHDLGREPDRRDGGPAGWPGAAVDGIAELQFASWADFAERFYDSPEGAAVIAADVDRFLSLRHTRAALVTPTVVLDGTGPTNRG